MPHSILELLILCCRDDTAARPSFDEICPVLKGHIEGRDVSVRQRSGDWRERPSIRKIIAHSNFGSLLRMAGG